nr:hypothetical protein [Tanacetum cinerariifolium]
MKKQKKEVKKKMVKLKGKKKVEDDDEDFVVEEQHDEEDDKKNFESKFKSLRARMTVLPLYDATQYLSPERKSKIREIGFASMLDYPFQKIPDKLPYFVLKNLNTEKMEVSLPKNMPTSGQGLSAATIEQLITQRTEAMAAYEANQNNQNRDGNPHVNAGGVVPVARECTYKDFVKCQPLNFKGAEGAVGSTRWFEKIEIVFHIINCPKKYQVKYASCNLQNSALTCWNSHKRTIRTDVAYAMTWKTLMKLMTKMVTKEEDRVEKFIRGLPDNIQGNKLKGYATRNAENKRRFDNDLRDNRVQQPPLKRQNVARAYTVGNNKNKGYARILPLCDKCKLHHHGPCPVKCGNCKKVGHQARDCWASTMMTCYGCGGKRHTKRHVFRPGPVWGVTGKIWYDEDVHDLRSVETEFPAIVFDDAFTSEVTPSYEPTVSLFNDNNIDFRISFDESDDEDYTVIYDENSFSYKIISVINLKTDSKNDDDKVNMPSFPSPKLSILKESVNEFFSSVEKTFDQCRQLNLNKFQLHTPYYDWFGSKINKWIRYVVKCNVRELDLSLEPMERKFEFHEFFFINSCFTQLILKGCILDPCGTVCWNKLKSLSISRAKFDEDVIQNILSGSPVLETLKFERCYGYNRIAITSKSVKNFVIAGCSTDLREKNLEINAPYIVSLTITDLCLWKLLLVDVSCLVKAHFDYRKVGYNDKTNRQEEENMLKGFMLKLGNVKEFAIGIHCARVIS